MCRLRSEGRKTIENGACDDQRINQKAQQSANHQHVERPVVYVRNHLGEGDTFRSFPAHSMLDTHPVAQHWMAQEHFPGDFVFFKPGHYVEVTFSFPGGPR
ncbi:hypothetical protein D3C84_534960 [compost metagenome]